ncbi:hypothetical protein FOPG_18047 [Fusarium oxysporum f. sp. conglutinans race 2 54008]|uniref:DNA/RNA-binding domain-containing protein n=3 Tax=Fusarium oxysporum f. sp. conglutinans TaxID=100902 RepID=A0A8H6G9L1_FUSOX|nr:hypothetical protein FOPG_18047 [Fusarium oxysporum f. sp. conglutinans race 2 54008]KAF6514214.1 hypothetical protein HZS61_006470 [Fusarium oxysporum f. sp. conglutinans]KAG6988759.1 hypothetical protein FocnCong_v001836 [Fusarium oxysporum f. sp. conglutinans]KAI8397421.1 hypothetical protein FOFC_20693 [Fusarium oxysporum]
MGGGPDKSEVPSRVEPSGASEDAPDDRPMTDSVSQDTSEVLAVTELDGASSQSPRPDKGDAVGIESHENTKVDDSDDNIATVTGERQDSANAVATEVEVVKTDNQDALHDPEKMIRQHETCPITNDQLVAEVKGIYDALATVEKECIEADDGQMPWTDGPLHIPDYLLTIPEAKLILLQKGNMNPAETVRLWYVKAQKDATKGDKKPWTLESAKDLPVSEKTAPHVGDPEDYLHGFQVALELRAKKLGWPEYNKLAAVNVAEIGEEAHKKVIAGKHYLDIGYDLVDQLLRDLETAKSRTKEPTLGLWAIWRCIHAGRHRLWNMVQRFYLCDLLLCLHFRSSLLPSCSTQQTALKETSPEGVKAAPEEEASEKVAPEAIAAQEAEVTSKVTEEIFKQIALTEADIASEKAVVASKEVEPEMTHEEVDTEKDFVKIIPEEAETALENVDPEKKCLKGSDADVNAAPEKAATIQQPSDHDANLSAQEPQPSPVKAEADVDTALEADATQQNSAQDASPSTPEPQTCAEEADFAPENVGKDTGDTAVDAVALDEKTKSESEKTPATELPIYVDKRPLSDQSRYKKVGMEYWVLISGRWIRSLRIEQYAALTALHRTNLHEHYDFLLASQHPSASPALRGLAAKYNMPARMWKHGIHSFLEVLRTRLPESQDIMEQFIILAYGIISLMSETVPSFRLTWVECKGDLARYGMAVEERDMNVRECWRNTAREEYTQARNDDPTVGRLYHHLAILVQPRFSSPDASFDADVSRFLYYIKSLVVKTPFYAARESLLTVINPIFGRNKEAAEKPASIPQTDQDHFLTAVAHLILASLEPETLKANGYEESRNNHLQTVYTALEKIKVGGPAKTSRICPSAQLGLLLCLLLLGIPLADNRWSPMMAKFAPDLVTDEDRSDSDAMANARDIHDATIELINTMVPYLLEDADTRGLGVWRFILVILMFMRSLKTRPALREWFGPAFHAEALTPYFNLILRQDESQSASALESASQSELITDFSPLNERERLGKYAFSTKDSIETYLRETEEQRKAERARSTATMGVITAEEATATPEAGTVTTDDNSVITGIATVTTEGSQTAAEESMVTTEQTTASDTTHKKDGGTKAPGSRRMYANFLPEHDLVTGLFFANEAESGPCDKSLQKPTKNAVQTAEVPTVEQTQEATLTDAKTDSEVKDGVLTDSASEDEVEYEILTKPVANEAQDEHQAKREAVEAPSAEVEMKERENKDERQQDSDTQTKEKDAEKTQPDDEQKPGEAGEEEAGEEEVRRQEGLRRDPPLFPNGWLKQSKHSFDEIQACDYVESSKMWNDRSVQILRLATQLNGVFFDLKTDDERRPWFSVLGASSVPKLGPDKMMPEIIERDSGFKAVFVDPSFHAVELKEEEERLARTEEIRKEKEDGVDVVNWSLGLLRLLFNRVRGLARFWDLVSCTEPTGALSIIAENGDDDDATSAFDLELRKTTRTAKTITAAEEPSSTDYAEPTESEA